MWALTLGLILLPTVLARLGSHFRRPPSPPRPKRPVVTSFELFVLALHVVLGLHALVSPPPDPLAGLPLVGRHSSVAQLRQRAPPWLAGAGQLDPLDARVLYGRFGPTPLVACHWCVLSKPTVANPGDHALFHWLRLLQAALEPSLVWVLLTSRPIRTRWRAFGLGSLSLIVLAEAAFSTFAPVRRGPTDDVRRLFLLLPPFRSLLFLLFPFLLLVLPPSRPSPPPPVVSLPAVLRSSSTLLQTLKLLELSHLSLARNPRLQAQQAAALLSASSSRAGHHPPSWGEATTSTTEAETARKDEAVGRAAASVGLHFGDDVQGGLRDGARRFLQLARANVERSLHQHQHQQQQQH